MPSKHAKKTKKTERGLSDQQKLFAKEYIIDLKGELAAIRAGYSKKTAAQQASRLLSFVKVQEEICRLNKERLTTCKVDADLVLKKLVAEVQADIADIYNDNGSLKPIREWPMVWRTGLVAGIEVEEIYSGKGEDRVKIGELRKLKIADRGRRLEMLGNHSKVKAFDKTVKVEAPDLMKELMDYAGGTAIRPKSEK